MNEKDEQLLEKYRWTVECYSPFELSTKDGSFARHEGAQYVLDGVRREDADTGEGQLTIPDVGGSYLLKIINDRISDIKRHGSRTAAGRNKDFGEIHSLEWLKIRLGLSNYR